MRVRESEVSTRVNAALQTRTLTINTGTFYSILLCFLCVPLQKPFYRLKKKTEKNCWTANKNQKHVIGICVCVSRVSLLKQWVFTCLSSNTKALQPIGAQKTTVSHYTSLSFALALNGLCCLLFTMCTWASHVTSRLDSVDLQLEHGRRHKVLLLERHLRGRYWASCVCGTPRRLWPK